ncbi:hypothetical protein [Acinetobacter sp.]|uniref:hypothetical protein n=1 Tax=Acinetobacter sp. TaxID=472 RepID=UPI0037524690
MKILKIILAIPLLFLGGWIALLALYTAVLILAGLAGAAYEGVFGSDADRKVQTHVTIYVDPQLQQDGGVVTVAAVPVDEQQWMKISHASANNKHNLAMLDPANPKQKKVKLGDLHGGVVISSTASSVEIYYPKTGSYTYNFLSLPRSTASVNETALAPLETKVVTAGSGSSLRDPETGGTMDWPSVNVLAIMGSKNKEGWARSADYQFSRIDEKEFSQAYTITKSPTTRVMQVTEFGLNKYFRCLPPVSCD